MRACNLLLLIALAAPQFVASAKKPDCSQLANGVFIPDQKSCSRYYICINGRAMRRQCAKGFYFDGQSLLCNLAPFVDCRIGRGLPTTLNETTTCEPPVTPPCNETEAKTTPCPPPATPACPPPENTPCPPPESTPCPPPESTPCPPPVTTTACSSANPTTTKSTTTKTTTTKITTTKTTTTKTTTTKATTTKATTTAPCTTTTTCSPNSPTTPDGGAATTCSPNGSPNTPPQSCECTPTPQPCTCSSTPAAPCSTTTPCPASPSTAVPVPDDLAIYRTSSDCAALKDGTFLLNRKHCRRYYLCSQGKVKPVKCSKGQWFDRESKTCRASTLVTNCPAMRN